MEQEEVKQNVCSRTQWLRIAYMLLFGFILYFVMMVMSLIVILQAIFSLITGQTNEKLRPFSMQLTNYISHIVLFLTYNSDAKPYPFSDWGEQPQADEVVEPDVESISSEPKPADTNQNP